MAELPIVTAFAPAIKNCLTSSADCIPPPPIIGVLISRAKSHTILNAIGLIAGPERPPPFLKTGFFVFVSITSGGK